MSVDAANREFALDVVRRLQGANYEAMWAGGCVRDRLLGHTPKDYDVATSAVPSEVRALFGESRTFAVGESFGVIIVRGPRGADSIEVATFRIDGGYSDGRRPDSVQFSSAEEDAQRRDFTINGMFFDPVQEQVIDYVDGQTDLERGVVRAIGNPDERFDEDKLRMLRAVRFAARFGFELEAATLTAIQRRPHDINVVSGERMGMEMTRMLTGPRSADAVRLLKTSNLLHQVLPEAMDNLQSHETAILNALQHLRTRSATPLALPLAIMLQSWTEAADGEATSDRQPKVISEKVAARWKLTNTDKASLRWLLEHEPIIREATSRPWPQVQRILTHEDADLLLDFAEACAVGSGESKASATAKSEIDFCREKIDSDPADWNPPPFLSGDDLRSRGLKPGPMFRELLTSVRDAQLNGEIHNLDDAWKLIRTLVEKSGQSLD